VERDAVELRTGAQAPASRRAPRRGTEPSAGDARSDADWRRLDRLASVGLLAAEAAHEVRNALTAVKTLLQLLPMRGDDPELRGPFLALAGEEVGRIERLLEALIEQARGGRPGGGGAMQRCDPSAAVQSVAQLVARRASERGLHLAVDLKPQLPEPVIPGDALRQVLLNLALNAIEATPSGGDVRFAARALGPALEISVEDRGPGVPPALRRRVFEPWFSTHGERAGGLGLAIARRLVEEAGGTIAIGDRPQGGARFRVRVPVVGGPG
jgi:signal transduction histidine kinase